MIHFDLPKDQSSILKVIGVGGGGSNAVNHMFSQNIDGVNFIICNTDAQAIAQSRVPNKIQLGPQLTQGLGAGANPEIGKQATEESLEEIRRILEVNTKMAFITAGMGGGTGTGGAPILAKICKDLGILTVGIVTTPFAYEGKKRIAQAEEGIMLLKQHVDTLLVISNDKLRHQFGNLKMKEAFAKADDILATAAKCITDVISSTGQINVDFADVCTVMKNGGVAILGSAAAEGKDRAHEAIEQALMSPLLNDNDIRGAKWILININSAEGEHEFTMDEVEVIQEYILARAGENTDVIMGLGYDSSLGDKIGITLIATGFEHKDPFNKIGNISAERKDDRVMMTLEMPVKDERKAESREQKAESDVVTAQGLSAKQESVSATQPAFEFEPAAEDTMMPTLKIDAPQDNVDLLRETTGDKNEGEKQFFEISSPSDHRPLVQFEELPETNNLQSATNDQTNGIISRLSSGGPVKPAKIYAEQDPGTAASDGLQPKSKSNEELPPQQIIMPADEPLEEMQLVVKESLEAAEIEKPFQVQPIQNDFVEEPAMPDEAEELRRRAQDRIAKLRNLSYNVNATDPNNEFETVPAYLRRNMEIHNQIADVETFYSNYTVRTDENNRATINSLNSFLDGKKPD